MKLPNGFGSVHKLPGNRRKPWRARITAGYLLTKDSCTQQYATLGYYKTKKDDLEALSFYHHDPYDLNGGSAKMNDLYNSWFDGMVRSKNASYQRVVRSAWKYCSDFWNVRIDTVRARDVLRCIEGALRMENGTNLKASITIQNRIKSILNLMFDYAVFMNLVPHNYARDVNDLADVIGTHEAATKTVFSRAEEDRLWELKDDQCAKIILVGIYSGWRPSELMNLKVNSVDFEQSTMLGGSKTDAGKNRIVPIHPKILELLKECCANPVAVETGYVFNLRNRNRVCAAGGEFG